MIKHKTKKNKKPKFFLRHLRGSGKKKNKQGGTKRKQSRVSNSRNTTGSSQSRGSSQNSFFTMHTRGSSQSSKSAQTSDSMQPTLMRNSKKKMRLEKTKHNNNNNSLMQKQRKVSDIKINKELYKQIQENGGLMQVLLDMIGSSYNLAIFSGFLQEGTSFPYENSDGTKLFENEQSRTSNTDPYICESSGRTRCSSCNLPPNFEEGLLFDGAHWKGYRGKKTKKIFDSYKQDIQVKGTNNYCQSFATYLWTSEGNHNKKHNVTLLKGKYSKNIQVVSCLWQKLFTEIKSNKPHFTWYVEKLNNDIDIPYFKKAKNIKSTIIFDIVLRILQELCSNEELARKFSTMRESNDSSELPELMTIFNL